MRMMRFGDPSTHRHWLSFWNNTEEHKYLGFAFEHVFGKEATLDLCHLDLRQSDGHEIKLAMCVSHLFGLFFTVELPHFRGPWVKRDRVYGWCWSGGLLMIDLGADPWGSWGKHISWNWHRTLFGQPAYETKTISESVHTLVLEEGSYIVNVHMFESTWTYPRFHKTHRLLRADCEIQSEKGIPTEGHGENDWDQDEDAIFSLTCSVNTPEEAVQRLRDTVLKERVKYGVPQSVQLRGII